MARIYVASSWRNTYQPAIVSLLRWKHEIYDFRNAQSSFKWGEIDPDWQKWTREEYKRLLETSSRAAQGFLSDLRGMMWCDTCVLVMPCGRSAHIEAGWCAGQGKRLIIYLPEVCEPDLMYLIASKIVLSEDELLKELS